MYKPLVTAMLICAGAPALADSAPCSVAERTRIFSEIRRDPESADDIAPVSIGCSIKLPTWPYKRGIRVQGAGASGAVIDCNYATLDGGPGTFLEGHDVVEVRSRKVRINPLGLWETCSDFRWEPAQNVTLRNCIIKGSLRVHGIRDTECLAEMSNTPTYVRDVRAAAPKNITLDNLTITAHKKTPVYIGVGSSYVTLINSELDGKAESVGVYLDAETFANTIRNNHFDVVNEKDYIWGLVSTSREELAIDGSSHNKIIGNVFANTMTGGISLYRNCGERATARHSTPERNTIVNNTFLFDKLPYGVPNMWIGPAVHIGSRGPGSKYYCPYDSHIPYGSGLDDHDFARFNVVMQNQFINRSVQDAIRSGDSSNAPNYIGHNESRSTPVTRLAGCWVSNGNPDFIEHGESIGPACGGTTYTCNDGSLIGSQQAACDVDEVIR